MAFESHVVTREKDLMIDLLLSGEKIAEIARRCNVSRATIYAWKMEPLVVAELEHRRELLKKAAQGKIISKVNDCVENMYMMAMSSKDHRVKFQANKFIIEHALGKPATSSEEDSNAPVDENNKSGNELKKELEDIKNIRAVK